MLSEYYFRIVIVTQIIFSHRKCYLFNIFIGKNLSGKYFYIENFIRIAFSYEKFYLNNAFISILWYR